jgi:hypothetical protein
MAPGQVPKQQSAFRWTLAELKDKKVLENFRLKLAGDPLATCWFVSADGAAPLMHADATAGERTSRTGASGVSEPVAPHSTSS